MAGTREKEDRCKDDQTVLNDTHITYPCEERFGPQKARVDKQRYEGHHGKGIEKQSIKPIFIPHSALNQISDPYGYESAMNDAPGNP